MKLSVLFYITGCSVVVLIVTQIILELNLLFEDFEITDEEARHQILLQYQVQRNYDEISKEVRDPVILWWTPFTGDPGTTRQCGSVSCFLTQDRRFRYHPMTKVLMFYGSNINVTDLPLPRDSSSLLWALLHEESPKNTPLLSHGDALRLFNYSSTFSRFSHFPLTTQYLKDLNILLDKSYLVPVAVKTSLQAALSPVVYIQSDCSTPLDRDAYVIELSKYINIDSYGACLHNRDLPDRLQKPMETMLSRELIKFVAQYKFSLSFENAECEDYITEKLWRPLIAGSVPIYIGSPSVKDWLPNNKSAILAMDFESPKHLADYLHKLNENDDLYNEYLQHKLGGEAKKQITNKNLIESMENRQWGINNDFIKGNFIEHFECFVCKKIHKKPLESSTVNITHYNCPKPRSPLTRKPNNTNWWLDQWSTGKCEAKIIREIVEQNVHNYTDDYFYNKLFKYFHSNLC